MNIRPATAKDVPDILPMTASVCALHQEWDKAKYNFKPNPQEYYIKWLLAQVNNERSVLLVAEDEEKESKKLVGFSIATVEREVPIYILQEYAFIHDLWVEPEYRQLGIAKQIIRLNIARFKEIGVTQIRLDTAYANEIARKLFSSCGFRISTIEMLVEL